jgi:hypothetical protein
VPTPPSAVLSGAPEDADSALVGVPLLDAQGDRSLRLRMIWNQKENQGEIDNKKQGKPRKSRPVGQGNAHGWAS